MSQGGALMTTFRLRLVSSSRRPLLGPAGGRGGGRIFDKNHDVNTIISLQRTCQNHAGTMRYFSSAKQHNEEDADDWWDRTKVNGFVGHNFPDFIEHWNRDNFYKVGYGLGISTAALATTTAMTATLNPWLPLTMATGSLTAAYWAIGLNDIKQTSHALRRNFPVLGNVRYVLETVRDMLIFTRHGYTFDLSSFPESNLISHTYHTMYRFALKFDSISSSLTVRDGPLIDPDDPLSISVPRMSMIL
jgi:hypothetical protein